VPGVTVNKYLRTVLNSHRDARGEDPISLRDFAKTVRAAMAQTNVPEEFSKRYLNEGFSGGEKKRMEILQLALMQPDLAVLDETDSGLDIDALRVVAAGVRELVGPEMGALVITHYKRILDHIQPDHVHVFVDGRIVKSGGSELADELEAQGYEEYEEVPA
jgi:Fe-S cluster assembly ATP-binding protein